MAPHQLMMVVLTRLAIRERFPPDPAAVSYSATLFGRIRQGFDGVTLNGVLAVTGGLVGSVAAGWLLFEWGTLPEFVCYIAAWIVGERAERITRNYFFGVVSEHS